MRAYLAVVMVYLMIFLPSVGWSNSGPHGSKVSSVGGGGTGFALKGDSLTEASLPIVRTAKTVSKLERTAGWQTYYFSSASGGRYPTGDTQANGATGSARDPFNATELANYCGKAGVLCVLDSGESFVLPAAILMNTQGCEAYPDEPCTAITTGGVQRATITTVGSTAAAGPIIAADGCPDNFDTGGPPQTSGNPDGLCDSDGATSTDAGWAVVENIHCISNASDLDAAGENDNMDCFSNNGAGGRAGKMLLLSTSAILTGDGSDNCYTSHLSGWQVILNGSCRVTGTTGNNTGYVPSHQSTSLAIGLDVTQEFAGGDAVIFSTSATGAGTAELVWIDGFVDFPSATTGSEAGIEINPDNGASLTARLARIGITTAAAGNCIRPVPATAGDHITLEFWQLTMTGCVDGLIFPNTTFDDAATVTVNGTAFTCDNMGNDCIDLDDPSWALGLTMNLSRWLYDSGDAFDVFDVEGVNSDSASQLQTDIDAQTPSNTVTVNAGTTIDADDAQVQWSDGTTTFARLNCIRINDCWGAYDDSYTVAFPNLRSGGQAGLPAWVFGSVATKVTLNGLDGNIGR